MNRRYLGVLNVNASKKVNLRVRWVIEIVGAFGDAALDRVLGGALGGAPGK